MPTLSNSLENSLVNNFNNILFLKIIQKYHINIETY